MESIIKSLVQELVKRDYAALNEKVANMPFEIAFKALDSCNLSAEPNMCGNELISISEFFDFNFGCLNGTIFKTNNGKCELGETYDIWVADHPSPIARCEIDCEGNVEMDKVWLF